MYNGIGHAVFFEANGYYPAVLLSFDAATGKASLAFWELNGSEQVMTVKHDVALHKPALNAYPCALGGGGPRNAIYMPDSNPAHRVVASLHGAGAAPGTLQISIPDAAGGVQVLEVPEMSDPVDVWLLDPTWQSPAAIVSAVAALLST
jgi:hypothetical protein